MRAHICNRQTKMRIYNKKNGFDPEVEDYDYKTDISRHWTHGIDLPYIINLLQLLCIQGVWDIGLYCKKGKKEHLPLFCPFDKRFYPFWQAHNMTSIFEKGEDDCCVCKIKREWDKNALKQHINTKKTWYHRALNTLIHSIYDNCDQSCFLIPERDISSSTKNIEHKKKSHYNVNR